MLFALKTKISHFYVMWSEKAPCKEVHVGVINSTTSWCLLTILRHLSDFSMWLWSIDSVVAQSRHYFSLYVVPKGCGGKWVLVLLMVCNSKLDNWDKIGSMKQIPYANCSCREAWLWHAWLYVGSDSSEPQECIPEQLSKRNRSRV